MTSTTKHILKLAPECEGSRDLMLKAGKMPSKMKMTDDDDDAPKTKKKRKKSAYNFFIADCLTERPKGQAVKDAMKSCGPRWKSLGESKREEYKQKAATQS